MLQSHVTVFGRVLEVIVMDLESENLSGDFNLDESIIRIHSGDEYETQCKTLFHECVHAALGISGLSNLLTRKLEEALVRCIEHAFGHCVDITKL